MTSPANIGAFFDLDGTLLPAPSLEWRFVAWLLARDEISGRNLARWLGRCAKEILRDRTAALDGNKLYLAGLPTSLVKEWARSLEWNPPAFCTDGIARLAWHYRQGHRVILVSGTLAPLARELARHLPSPMKICATELDALDGVWTGWLTGDHMSGWAKARAAIAQAALHRLDLSHSIAYGNDASDIPLLELAGHRLAVNPTVNLCRAARKRGWPIARWTTLESAGLHPVTAMLAPKGMQ
jgi:HAD superfamily hydrolase (TIGR01490 family)